jgi:hypothetical protein
MIMTAGIMRLPEHQMWCPALLFFKKAGQAAPVVWRSSIWRLPGSPVS